MAFTFYECDALDDGTANSLDSIAYSGLTSDTHIAFTYVSNVIYFHRFDSSSAAAESSPDTIKPDDAGTNNGRWILQNVYQVNIDGDTIDIDWNPSNYTPDSSIAEASDADDLSAHLKGIDVEIGLRTNGLTSKTTDYTLTANNLNGFGMFDNDGAAGQVTYSLPALAAGYGPTWFYVTDAQYLKIAANGSDTIRYLNTQSAAGGYFRSNTVGNYLVVASNADEWMVVGIGGMWLVDE